MRHRPIPAPRGARLIPRAVPRPPLADAASLAAARAAAAGDAARAALAAAAAGAPVPVTPTAAALAAAAVGADATLMAALDLACMEAGGAEYRQVVLLGPGLDPRPGTLPWPPGTIVYDVAPADAHAVAAAAAAKAGGGRAAPRRGVLHVRVAADAADASDDITTALADRGHRGDRLTAAAASLSHLDRGATRRALAALASALARCSLLTGDLAAAGPSDAADLLAEAGVVADVAAVAGARGVFSFTGQARARSDAERELLEAHEEAAEEAEGFEGNVS